MFAVFAPTYYLGVNGGMFTATYDPVSNAVEFYQQAFQSYRGYSDPLVPVEQWPYPSGIWVAPTSPDAPVPVQDGRTDQYYSSKMPKERWTMQAMIDRYLNMPMDYDIYDNPEEYCPQSKKDQLEDVWEKAMLEAGAETGNLMGKITRMTSLLRLGAEGTPCGSSYMSSDYGAGVTGLGLNEFSVWSHLILEIDPEHTGYMATSEFWNDWSSVTQD